MRLRGNCDSKPNLRLQEVEKRQEAERQRAEVARHHPQLQDGGVAWTCCGARYAHDALRVHLEGGSLNVMCGGIYMTSVDRDKADARFTTQAPHPGPLTRPEDDAVWRSEMISRFLESENRFRRRPIRVSDEDSTYGF